MKTSVAILLATVLAVQGSALNVRSPQNNRDGNRGGNNNNGGDNDGDNGNVDPQSSLSASHL